MPSCYHAIINNDSQKRWSFAEKSPQPPMLLPVANPIFPMACDLTLRIEKKVPNTLYVIDITPIVINDRGYLPFQAPYNSLKFYYNPDDKDAAPLRLADNPFHLQWKFSIAADGEPSVDPEFQVGSGTSNTGM